MRVGTIIIFSAALSGAPAAADDLTPSAVSNDAFGTTSAYYYDLSKKVSLSDGGSSLSLVLDPGGLDTQKQRLPTLDVNGVSAASGVSTSAFIDLNYGYEVLGSTTPVPVDVAYILRAQTTSQNVYEGLFAGASLTIVQQPYPESNPYYDIYYNAFSQPGYSPTTVSGVLHTTDNPGTANLVELAVREATVGGPSMSSTAEAFADPYIYIDPAYSASHPGLVLEVSSGIGNLPTGASALPEPMSWVMMVCGLGAAGWSKRRSGRKPDQSFAAEERGIS